jgi:hypothetical protein
LRPFARREASTRRPFFVDILSRKPWLWALLLLWGWNVLFIFLYFYYCYFSVKKANSHNSGCKSTDNFRNNKELCDF